MSLAAPSLAQSLLALWGMGIPAFMVWFVFSGAMEVGVATAMLNPACRKWGETKTRQAMMGMAFIMGLAWPALMLIWYSTKALIAITRRL